MIKLAQSIATRERVQTTWLVFGATLTCLEPIGFFHLQSLGFLLRGPLRKGRLFEAAKIHLPL